MIKQPLGTTSRKTSHIIPPLSRDESEKIMNSMISPDATSQPKPPDKEPWFIGREGEQWLEKDPFLMQSVDEVALDLATELADGHVVMDSEMIVRAFISLGSHVRTAQSVHPNVLIQFDHSDRMFVVPVRDVTTLAEEKLIHLTT